MNRLMVLGTLALVAIAACSPDSKSISSMGTAVSVLSESRPTGI